MGANRFLFTNKAMGFVVAVTALFSTATAFAEVRIVALGDSEIQVYPAQLEAALRARGHQVTVTNQGVNGDTTAGMLARLESAVPPGTDIVILWGGDRRAIVEHLRTKGVEVVVRRNLPTIEALVRKVEKQGACRPQCWYQTYPPWPLGRR
jgi:uroporphyrinogen-III synthase